jgi:hypothetical protein
MADRTRVTSVMHASATVHLAARKCVKRLAFDVAVPPDARSFAEYVLEQQNRRFSLLLRRNWAGRAKTALFLPKAQKTLF